MWIKTWQRRRKIKPEKETSRNIFVKTLRESKEKILYIKGEENMLTKSKNRITSRKLGCHIEC